MKTIILITLLVLNGLFASAQNIAIDSIKLARVGDKLPSEMLQFKNKVLTAGGNAEVSLSEHADKLIILDFWANWCGTCVGNFAFLDSLQAQYPNDLKVLLVNSVGTGDKNEAILETVMAKTGKLNHQPLFSVIEDRMLLKAFPHRGVPHYVWIYGNTVRAITTDNLLTRANLEMMLARKTKSNESMRKFYLLREGRPLKKKQ